MDGCGARRSRTATISRVEYQSLSEHGRREKKDGLYGDTQLHKGT
jgi:hypothetical protein